WHPDYTTISDLSLHDALPISRLQVRHRVELVQHHLREGVLFQLDHQAHPVAIALVAHLFDALDALLADELPDLGGEARPVYLVRSEEHTSELQSRAKLVWRLL